MYVLPFTSTLFVCTSIIETVQNITHLSEVYLIFRLDTLKEYVHRFIYKRQHQLTAVDMDDIS